MKIYLDCCCYNRPYDDQTQADIRAETNAIENIINIAQQHGHIIFNSAALDKEIGDIKIKYPDKHSDVHGFYVRTATNRTIMKKGVETHYAPLLQQAGIKKKDAAHLIMAISAVADYLITTDKDFIHCAAKMQLPLRVINPLNFPLGGKI